MKIRNGRGLLIYSAGQGLNLYICTIRNSCLPFLFMSLVGYVLVGYILVGYVLIGYILVGFVLVGFVL